MKRGAGAGPAPRPDTPAMRFNQALANGQADSRAGIFSLAMKPLKGAENLFRILRVKSDSLITHRHMPFTGILPRVDMDARLLPRLAKLDGIGNQVLENQ